jgi:hypothetical protein
MVIYRISKGRKQYLCRIVQYRPLWHQDRNLALKVDGEQAAELVEKLKQSAKPVEEIGLDPE